MRGMFSIIINSTLKCPGSNSDFLIRLKVGCSIRVRLNPFEISSCFVLSKHVISQHSIAVESFGNQTIPHIVKINARFAKHGTLLVEPARSMGGPNIRTILRRKMDVMRTQDTSMMKRKSPRNNKENPVTHV